MIIAEMRGLSRGQHMRGKALEIVDDQGRIRASISVLPAKDPRNPSIKTPIKMRCLMDDSSPLRS